MAREQCQVLKKAQWAWLKFGYGESLCKGQRQQENVLQNLSASRKTIGSEVKSDWAQDPACV